ncbi:ATP-binding cassette subfamily C protein CydC [Halospina denitrificans]|uniref:ATP-binding cassette subfamily C protein CydC n=1 Tax=Halospina denitrificans TaxID=332522 RepID=A0A4R7JZ33_9GAMM|nr:thiol reductant ABC exporter subunit CydC [Halospina denitrificans]TDT43366.1 ATP-binding cassette subfamily C protein CydC [Halospina denitrificans]
MTELRPWLSLLLRHRGRLVLGALLMTATLLSGVGLLALSGWFITATAVTALAWGAGLQASLNLYVPGGGIRFFALSRTASRYFERLHNHDTVLRLLADLRVCLFQNLVCLDERARSGLRSAQLLNRLVSDVDTLDNLYLRQIAPPVVALVAVLAVTGLIAFFALPIALFAGVVLLLLLGVVTVGVALVTRRLSAREGRARDLIRSRVVDQLRGLAELQAASQLVSHQEQLLRLEAGQRHCQYRLAKRTALAQALSTLGVQALVVIVLILAALAWQAEVVSGPVMVMMPLAVMALSEGFSVLPAAFAQWGATEAAASRLNEQSSLTGCLPEPDEPAPVPAHPAITWSGIAVARGTPSVFDDFNLSLAPGEHIAITGPSGSGKSTLALLLARLLEPDEGAVLADGRDIRQFHGDEWRQRIALLSQDAHLFNESIAENLRLALPQATDARLWEVLAAVQLDETVRAFSLGLETRVGEMGGQVSGGEARRLALARVLLKQAPIVVLDEPFTGLDRGIEERVRTSIQPWLAGRSVVFLLHEGPGPDSVQRVIRLPLDPGWQSPA